MALILSIETTTPACSVALHRDDLLITNQIKFSLKNAFNKSYRLIFDTL